MLSAEGDHPPTEATPLQQNATHVQKYGPTYLRQDVAGSAASALEHSVHSEQGGSSSLLSAYFNELNTVVGIGIIGMPYVLSKVGVVGGLVTMIIFASLCVYTLILQIRASNIMVFNLKCDQSRLISLQHQRSPQRPRRLQQQLQQLSQGSSSSTTNANVPEQFELDQARLSRITKIVASPHYEDLCEYCFGRRGYLFVLACLFVYDVGSLISYFIIIADNASRVLLIVWERLEASGASSDLPQIVRLLLTNRELALFVIAVFIVLPACLPRDLSALERLSAFSVFTKLLLVCVVIYEFVALTAENEHEMARLHSRVKYFDASGLSQAVGTFAFSFVAHDTAFLIYNTLYKPSLARWGLLQFAGIASAVCIAACFAVPGYLTFAGSEGGVDSNVLNSYPTHSGVMVAMRSVYALAMALSFPITFYVVRHCLFVFVSSCKAWDPKKGAAGAASANIEESVQTASLGKHLLCTLPLFVLVLGVSLVVDSLGVVISLVGSVACINLGFVLPCACYLKLGPYKVKFWNENTYEKKCAAAKHVLPPALLIGVGVFLAVFTTIDSIIGFYG